MILELAARGDLKAFLRDCRPTGNEEALLSLRHRVKLGIDIANGMKFLSLQDFVHRDLACRYVSARVEANCGLFRLILVLLTASSIYL